MSDISGSKDPAAPRASNKTRRRTRRRGAGVEEIRREPTFSSEAEVEDKGSFELDDANGFTGGLGGQWDAGHNRFSVLMPTESLPDTASSTPNPLLAPPSSAFSFVCSRIPIRTPTPCLPTALTVPKSSTTETTSTLKLDTSITAQPTRALKTNALTASAPLTESPTSYLVYPTLATPPRSPSPFYPPNLPTADSKPDPPPTPIPDTLTTTDATTTKTDTNIPSGWPATPITISTAPLKPRTKDGRSRFFPKKQTTADTHPLLTGNEKEAILKAQEVVLPPPGPTTGRGLWQAPQKKKQRPAPLDLSVNGATPRITHKIAVAGPLAGPLARPIVGPVAGPIAPKTPPPSYSAVVSRNLGPIAPPQGSKYAKPVVPSDKASSRLPVRRCKIFGGASAVAGTGSKKDGDGAECEKLIDDSCGDESGDKLVGLPVEEDCKERKMSVISLSTDEENEDRESVEWEGVRAEFWVRELVG